MDTYNNIFSTVALTISENYPKLYIGSDLDTSKEEIPVNGFYTFGSSTKTLIFNSVRVSFILPANLPESE